MKLKVELILVSFLISIFFISSCQNNFTGCTLEAKICPDGSSVGRSGPNCEFEKCPELIQCGVNLPGCPTNYGCYTDRGGPHCLTGDLCARCESKKCIILESYPAKIKCE